MSARCYRGGDHFEPRHTYEVQVMLATRVER